MAMRPANFSTVFPAGISTAATFVYIHVHTPCSSDFRLASIVN